jgi:hypothetical protein
MIEVAHVIELVSVPRRSRAIAGIKSWLYQGAIDALLYVFAVLVALRRVLCDVVAGFLDDAKFNGATNQPYAMKASLIGLYFASHWGFIDFRRWTFGRLRAASGWVQIHWRACGAFPRTLKFGHKRLPLSEQIENGKHKLSEQDLWLSPDHCR